MEPSLVIMAAGLGSRFGSLKQLAPIGPNGETILHYSIYDARRAGFKKVIFIIQSFFAEDFEKKILPSASCWMDEVELVYQDLTSPILGKDLPTNRKKPLGTAHAVLSAQQAVSEPFAVINADDFYGYDAFSCLYENLSQQKSPHDFSMVGYTLKNTLSSNGTVSRGICEMRENHTLAKVVEYVNITEENGAIYGQTPTTKKQILSPGTVVSLNTWGFSPLIFEEIQKTIDAFLLLPEEDQLTQECYLPTVVDKMIHANEATVHVIPCHSRWYGVTYKEDLEFVREAMNSMISEGLYPENLFIK